jgi:manganese/zinc/iron transport system permease protein
MRKYHTFWPRFCAGFVDGLVFLPIAFLDGFLTSPDRGAFLVIVWGLLSYSAYWLYSVLLHARYGQTLGKMAAHVKAGLTAAAPAMPTGPWIVLSISVMAYGSFLLAPQKGLLARRIQQNRHQRKTLHENILKLFYELGEAGGHSYQSSTLDTLLQHRPMPTGKLLQGLKRLQKQNMLQREGDGWVLTIAGNKKGEAISQLHRLWELYLTEYLKVKPDHAHEEAESIEHIITPALAEELGNLVNLHTKQK